MSTTSSTIPLRDPAASQAAAPESAVGATTRGSASPAAAAAPKPTTALSPPAAAPVLPKKRLTKEEIEKQKREEALARKKAQDARFKNRSKRKSDAVEGGGEPGSGKKKAKELSAYEKEVAEINKRVGLSDTGAGVRPVTK